MMLRLGFVGLLLAGAGCSDAASEDGTTSGKPSASVSAKPSATPTSSDSAAANGAIPLIVVDDIGPTVGGQRALLKKPGGPEKLVEVVTALKLDGTKDVPIKVEKKAKLTDVVALVRVLGDKGAKIVRITADSRGDLPKELVVVPQTALKDKVAPCSVVTSILPDFASEVWTVKGTTAKRGAKGTFGPDMTVAGENITKELKSCDSKIAFFTADDSLDWAYAHMAGGALVTADSEKKIQQLVLLTEVGTPGKPIKGLGF